MSAANRNSSRRGGRMQMRPRVKIYARGVYFVLTSSFIFISLCSFILIILGNSNISEAATSGDYRSLASGNWNSNASWEKYNGSSWAAATSAPSNSDGVITILSGHLITVSANVTADQIVVDAGGEVSISSGKNLTLNSGSDDDFIVNGTLTIFGTLTSSGSTTMLLSGSITLKSGGNHNFSGGANITINNGGRYNRDDSNLTTSAGTFVVNSGGIYQHNIDGQNIIEATWNSGSVCEITGITGSKPGKLDQTFSSFLWNCPNQTTTENLSGKLENITGVFTLISTGTGKLRFSQGENYTLNVGGNFNVQGGTLYATTKSKNANINITGNYNQTGGTFAGTDLNSNNGEGDPVITVTGNFIFSSGTFDLNQYTGSSATKGITTINLKGDFTQTGGTLTETATQTGTGIINFKKSGTQAFSKTGGSITNAVDFTVYSGSVLDMGTSVITGSGDFILSSGGGLNSGSTSGITLSSASGNVQVTGSRSFNSGSYYTYNGIAAQVSGDGLPSAVNKLTINNSSHVTLTNTVSVSNTLTFTSGNLITSGDTVIVGTSTSTLGAISRTSGHVVGYLKRWIGAIATSNILFPVGTTNYYQGINYTFTVAPSAAGSITSTYTSTDPGRNGLNLFDLTDSITSVGYGLWTSTPGNGTSGGTFSVDISATALPSVLDYINLHLLRRANSSAPWTVAGVHSIGTGSNSIPVVHRVGLTSHGQFGIGSGSANPLPIELIYFKAKLDENIVKLSWATASELNNDYFTIERSSDGIHFEEILRQKGAGNNTFTLYYSAEDVNPLNGYNYYRLKQTDYDGHFTYSDVETVKFKVKAEEEPDLKIISVAPNPFSENFNINFTSKKAMEIDIMLINSNGQMVAKNKIQTTEGFNTYEFTDNYNLNKGVYFLYIVYDGQKITQKIIKN